MTREVVGSGGIAEVCCGQSATKARTIRGTFYFGYSDYVVWVALNHFICIRVASAAEGAAFEVIAAPQEQPEQAQEERRENPAQGPSDPSSEQQPEGKPPCTIYYF